LGLPDEAGVSLWKSDSSDFQAGPNKVEANRLVFMIRCPEPMGAAVVPFCIGSFSESRHRTDRG